MQLKQGLDVAFLNDTRNFYDAKSRCESLGWYAPRSIGRHALPQAGSGSNSLEGVGRSLKESLNLSTIVPAFWSSSADSTSTGFGLIVAFPYGVINTAQKTDYNAYLVCVGP